MTTHRNSPSKPEYKHLQVTHALTWVNMQTDYIQSATTGCSIWPILGIYPVSIILGTSVTRKKRF